MLQQALPDQRVVFDDEHRCGEEQFRRKRRQGQHKK
jgi:hypothetical protein